MARRIHPDRQKSWVNFVASDFPGLLVRIYDADVGATLGTVPAGTKLAELTIPATSHTGAVLDTSVTPNRYVAEITGTWRDAAADVGGTPRSYTLVRPDTGAGEVILEDGKVRGPSSTDTDIDMRLDRDVLSAGAPFSISKWPVRQVKIG